MRDIVYYGLINGTVIVSAIFHYHSLCGFPESARRRSIQLPVQKLPTSFHPVRQVFQEEMRSFRDEVIEKLDSIHREMQEHIAACQQRRLSNREHPKTK